jgi:LmbE family N-acetylglucosaminyl deacetylase
MLTAGLPATDEPLHVLCLGAHADDIEIGCGGTILRLQESGRALAVTWVVFSAAGERRDEAAASAELFLSRAKTRTVLIQGFRDGFLPYHGAEVKGFFEDLKRDTFPDLVLTHYGRDAHQDHRMISELTWNTFRDHLILEYEIPKYDGDLGSPNTFTHLDRPLCQQKVDHILGSFRTQRGKQWFSAETFLAILRLRGIESNAPDGYAEAFYSRKLILDLGLNRTDSEGI